MTDEKKIRHSRAVWGIAALFSIAGACAGFAASHLLISTRAASEVSSIRTAYEESRQSRQAALDMCLTIAPQAAQKAAAAATKAADAAEAAKKAAGKVATDEERIEGEIR
ncbi:hypothetical protein [Klebsiella phage vB_KpnP_ZX1]|nr:hypothetical protein [Klebsiella phage vB_KpnP_ZX1]